jgi:hypothetical protein
VGHSESIGIGMDGRKTTGNRLEHPKTIQHRACHYFQANPVCTLSISFSIVMPQHAR